MATETLEQPKKQLDPLTKLIKIKKEPTGKWEFTFKGPLRQSEVNHLIRALRVEFARFKRKDRVKRQAELRKTNEAEFAARQAKELKEQTDGR